MGNATRSRIKKDLGLPPQAGIAMTPNKIITGDCLEVMKDWPDGSVNCCISSPPYWALRDYGVDGQLGLEPTFEEYIDKLCTIYDEVKRVLRPDGTCWVNLGDTYAGSGRGGGGSFEKICQSFRRDRELIPKSDYQVPGISAKSLCLIPQRFAIEMVNRGWILRNTIIWHKPNPMPSSAKDRFTVDFEYVFFFVKNKKYWFEQQYEEYVLPMNRWGGIYTDGNVEGSKYLKEDIDPAQLTQRPRSMRPNALGRNKRTVWTIPTQPYPESHFATFPEKLVEPMIKAGCPEFVCKKCGKAREKVYDVNHPIERENIRNKTPRADGGISMPEVPEKGWQVERTEKGYTDCGCGEGFRPGIVCDPFCGKWYCWTSRCSIAA